MTTTTKAEIGNYSISARFGGKKKIAHDAKWRRPQSRREAIEQIEETYRYTRWGAVERAANAVLLGLEAKPRSGDYTDRELKIILDDMEKYQMIIYRED